MKLPIEKIIDEGLKYGIVPDAKFHFMWDELAHWQKKTLVDNGLKSNHKLLDIGCGPVRLGLELAPYLNNGFYCGIDAYEKYILLAKDLLKNYTEFNNYELLLNNEFKFEEFGKKFDYAFSQSVFTHLSKDQIRSCLQNLKPVMKKGSKLIFTYISYKKTIGTCYYGNMPLIFEGGIGTEFYQQLANDLGITFERLKIEHPTFQKVGQFIF